jgi:ABC-2 type transport system ATP-binding protein
MDTALEIRGVGKTYPGFALRDVDLTLPAGYVMGLIGPNGAGKTTLIKLVMNLIRREAGEIEIFGLDNIAHEAETKSRIGFVYDEPCYPHDANAGDLGRAIGPFYPGWSDDRYRRLLAEFEVPPRKRFKTLSKGTQMKLALALALAHDADLLLMDEPTAGLDLAFRRELLDHLSNILQDERKTVLLSTHITSDLERFADFITLIDDGEIVLSLPTDDLRDGWGIVRGDTGTLQRLEAPTVRSVRQAQYGVEALVSDASSARARCGPGVVVDRPSLDDILVLMTTGEAHVEAH